MEYNQLGNTDMHVSRLSLGTSVLVNDNDESIGVIREALANGVNYIDTAPWYGLGEAERILGKALQHVSRGDYFLATKVGRYEKQVQRMFDFSAEATLRSFDKSLQRLGVDYVDVISVHDMEFAPSLDIIIEETLPALQQIKEAGKARYIGITGYPLTCFKEVLERSLIKVDLVLSYSRYTLLDTSLLEYLPYFKEKAVGVINAAPLGMGLLTDRDPPIWHPAPPAIREACKSASHYCRTNNVDIAKLGLQFSMSLADVQTTLCGTDSVDLLHKNLILAKKNVLSDHEKDVMTTIIDRYFRPLQTKHWEGFEVAKYHRKLERLNNPTDVTCPPGK